MGVNLNGVSTVEPKSFFVTERLHIVVESGGLITESHRFSFDDLVQSAI